MKHVNVCPTRYVSAPQDIAARIETIRRNPNFRRLASARTRLGLSLATTMATLYFAYILTVALAPGALGTPVLPGAVTTWGILAGVGLLSLGFVLTAIYVAIANRHFDHLTTRLEEEMQ
ncbi:DUF485 domain-containing protein [Xanthobacter autotrophicus]|uniref:DUF485 domain-containing protein n=1 Tax=Xanthobacter autotrophicus TaxID=280 RepID=UPI003728185F